MGSANANGGKWAPPPEYEILDLPGAQFDWETLPGLVIVRPPGETDAEYWIRKQANMKIYHAAADAHNVKVMEHKDAQELLDKSRVVEAQSFKQIQRRQARLAAQKQPTYLVCLHLSENVNVFKLMP
jgi:hypothetical protein